MTCAILPLANDSWQLFTADVVIDGEPLNDLMFPFAHLRGGKGLGSLFVLRNADSTVAGDPGRDNLAEFSLLFGDTFVEEGDT